MAKRQAAVRQRGLREWYADAEELLKVFDQLHRQFADARPLRSVWCFEDGELPPIGPMIEARKQAAESLQNQAEWILARLGSLAAEVTQPPNAHTLLQTAAALGVFECGPFGERLAAWDVLAPYGYAVRRWVAELAPFWQLDAITPSQNAMFHQHLDNCPYSQDIQRRLRNRLRLEHGQLLRDNATQTAVATAAAAKRKRKGQATPNTTKQDLLYLWLRGWHGYATGHWKPGPVKPSEFLTHISEQTDDCPSGATISRFFKKHFGSYDGYAVQCHGNRIELWFKVRESETPQIYQGWKNADED